MICRRCAYAADALARMAAPKMKTQARDATARLFQRLHCDRGPEFCTCQHRPPTPVMNKKLEVSTQDGGRPAWTPPTHSGSSPGSSPAIDGASISP